jgi:NosR/NirI family transcriptional regulator, nitrous oxide reductase regulator
MNPIRCYMRWLHTRWPAGHVEKLPAVNPDGSTAVPGLYVVGDITGIPLLKFSSDTGARAVQTIMADTAFQKRDKDASRDGKKVLDLVVVGAGVSGVAAAIEARKNDLSFELLEASEPFSTVVNFPRGKPIFTYPTGMTPAGELQFGESTAVKEGLVDTLNGYLKKHDIQPRHTRAERITRKGGLLEVVIPDGKNLLAHRVVVGIGRSGNFRKLGVPGEDLGKVSNRLHDPKDYCDKKVLIVGGGDTAMETAIALGACGSHVTVSYRKPEFSRPKPENVEKLKMLVDDPMAPDAVVEEPSSERVTTAAGAFLNDHRKAGSVTLMMASRVKEIREDEAVVTDADGVDRTIANDAVFTMIGREPPLDFFRRSGVPIRGEWGLKSWVGLAAMVLLCVWVYHWKSDYLIPFGLKDTFNRFVGLNPAAFWKPLGGYFDEPGTLGQTLKISASSRSFYYTFTYALLVTIFGIRRIRRRKTPYVTRQTLTLMAIQVVPLFLLPEIILPWLGHNGVFGTGFGRWFADEFFPAASYGHGREYWRAYGFVLAWPLMAWNWFTDQPMAGWLVLGSIQTFVVIPLMVHRWGKGAYCGWVCSCGALAETMGDTHRHKMPHGPKWNRLNMIGQVFLLFAVSLMLLRIAGWVMPDGNGADKTFKYLSKHVPLVSYGYLVDLLFAGILGVAFYFHLSGRVWCRFACPLAALMHIYARFSRFRILSEKKKCISCNVCTGVCHQGIDIMNFANKGLPMEDPQCVRCSACVQSCPTGVLSFGRINRKTGEVIAVDTLGASPVRMAELTVNGKTV